MFGHKGPTPYKREKDEVVGVCQSFFAQPHFNHRETVNDERFDNLLKTCLGDSGLNLVTHGMALVPYSIQSKGRYTQHNIKNPRFKGLAVNFKNDCVEPFENMDMQDEDVPEEEEKEEKDPNVFIMRCYGINEAEEMLIGQPWADPNYSEDISEVFKVMIGEQALSRYFKLDKETENFIQEKGKDNARLRGALVFHLMMKLIGIEYEDFKDPGQWWKLYHRLKLCLGKFASTMLDPTSVNDLIHQCMVMVNATSQFRIACLDGQGRQMVVAHALLGIHPSNATSLQKDAPTEYIGDFDYTIVGEANANVRMYDFGFKDFSEKKALRLSQQYSTKLQHRTETVAHTNVLTFIDSWCTTVKNDPKKYIVLWNNPEFTKSFDERDLSFYKAAVMKKWLLQRVGLAIKYMSYSMESNVQHAKYFKVAIDHYVTNAKDKDKPTGALTPENVSSWLTNKITNNFNTGYLLRSKNIACEELTDLIVLLTHSIRGNPNKDPTSNVRLIAQSSCRGTFEWDASLNLFYPSPTMFQNASLPPTFHESDHVSILMHRVMTKARYR